METSILCSVVIPAYQCEEYIEECIRSVESQTISNIEIIVVDDASTDGTGAIVKKLAEGDARIKYFRQLVNSGVARARNFGVSKAAASWTAFLDSDDAWQFNKLERQLAIQKKTNADLIYTGAYFIDGRTLTHAKRIHVPEEVSIKSLKRGSDIICSSVLVRTELMRRFIFERDDLHEDFICWFRIINNGFPASGVDEPLTIHRVLSHSKSSDKLKSARMTWNTLKFLELPAQARIISFVHYVIHGIRRYF